MNSIRQYRPAFFTGFPDLETREFATLDEMLAIPWVKSFRDDIHEFNHTTKQRVVKPFHRYSLSFMPRQTALMAEYDEGYEWWVVGFVADGDAVDLPKWDPPTEEQRKERARIREMLK